MACLLLLRMIPTGAECVVDEAVRDGWVDDGEEGMDCVWASVIVWAVVSMSLVIAEVV